MKNYIYLVFVLVVFSACSTKEVFEPENTAGDWENTSSLDYSVVEKEGKVAVLENNTIMIDSKPTDIKIEPGYRLLGLSNDFIVITNIEGNLKLIDKKTKKEIEFELKKTIATASTDGDVLAVIFSDGALALYDLSSKSLLLKLDGTTSIALDSRIVMPYFMQDLVLFMTLDGKVIIVNKRLKKKLRTIIVSSSDFFNNIIYFDILKDKLIVATNKKILSFGSSEQRVEYEARNITHDENNLYVATKQGDIISLTPNLKEIAKAHFSFAHFLALHVKGDKIYALEKEGYLIVASKDLLKYKIYEVDIDDEGYVYQDKDKIIVEDEVINLK